MRSVGAGRLRVGALVVAAAIPGVACTSSDERSVVSEPDRPVTTDPIEPTSGAAPTTFTADLGELDRRQIFAAAAAHRLAGFRTAEPWVTAEVVDSVGRVDSSDMVYFARDNAKLSVEDRQAITVALAPLEVRFVRPSVLTDPECANSDGPDGNVVLQIAEPDLDGEQPTITTAMWCGPLCAAGGASGLSRGDDGAWTITGPIGPQWVA